MATAIGVLPFPASAWADDGVTLTGDGVATYIDTQLGSSFFKNYTSDASYIKSTIEEPTKTFIIDISEANALTDCLHNGRTAIKISQVVNMFKGKASIPSGYNALAVKLYDQTSDSYYYKVLGTKDNNYTSYLFEAVNKEIFSNSDISEQLLEAITNNDSTQIKTLMEKYLPEFYYVVLSDIELANLPSASSSLTTDFFLNDSNSLNVDDKDLVQLQVRMQFTSGAVQQDDSSRSYAYDNITLDSNAVWRPTDRAIKTSGYYDGTITLDNRYWITSAEGLLLVDDPEVSDKLKITDSGTSIVYTSEETVLTGSGPKTVISTKELITGENSLIDLTYANTNSIDGKEPSVLQESGKVGQIETGLTYESGGKTYNGVISMARILLADSATLGNNTTFRLGKYSSNSDGWLSSDMVYIVQANQAQTEIDGGNKTTLYYQIGWVPGIGTNPFGEGTAAGGIGIYTGAENFEVIGEASVVDGIFSNYVITPEVIRYDNYYRTENSKIKFAQNVNGNYYVANTATIIMNVEGTAPFQAADPNNLTQAEWEYLNSQNASPMTNTYDNTQGTYWTANYSYEDTREIAESGKSVSENSSISSKLAKTHNINMFRRADELHLSNLNKLDSAVKVAGELDGELRESVWADVWHGKYRCYSRLWTPS